MSNINQEQYQSKKQDQESDQESDQEQESDKSKESKKSKEQEQESDKSKEQELDQSKEQELDQSKEQDQLKELDQSKENIENFASLFQNIEQQVNTANNTIKFLKTNIKELNKLYKQEVRKLGKYKKKTKRGNNKSGINKPNPVPQKIKDLLNLEDDVLMSRIEITKGIYGYIKENDLQHPDDRRTVIPNDELKQLFSLEDDEEISFYNIQTYIKKVFNQT